jgi:Transposase DDE domain
VSIGSIDETARTGCLFTHRCFRRFQAQPASDTRPLPATPRSIRDSRNCRQIIEPVFGQIKHARGIRGFMRRGKAAVDSEWKLICGTHNLLKLYRRALTNASAAPYSRMAAGTAA